MKDTIASLEQEEKELELKAFGTPVVTEDEVATTTESPETSATESLTDTEAAPARTEGTVIPEPEPVTDEQKDTKIVTEDWELRYKNLRAGRDQKLYDAKRQLSGALQTISTLQTQVSELQAKQPKVDPLDGVFTTEDVENLGEGTVDALTKATRKATEAATASLEKQLQDQRDLRAADQVTLADKTKQETYDLFIGQVARAVPSWEAINYEKGFEEYLKGPDVDGRQRKAYFSQAEAQGNAALIIRYMRDYEATKTGTPTKVDQLADKVTPTGETAGQTHIEEGTPETVSKAFIDKFYDDLNRGRYKGKHSEVMAIEAKIDKATMGGHIVR
jgi:hypothetical protein